jgi:sec-independent protein translocase protein TatB
MFDIGWTELLVLGAIALIVVGPKDLPGLLRTLGQAAGKARRMAREFQSSMEDAAREVDMSELRDVQKSMKDWNQRIGGESPKKFAERMAKQAEGTGAKGAAAPASGETPAAEAAPADPAPQPPAASASEPPVSRAEAAGRSAAEMEAEARDDEAGPRRDA